MSWRALVLAVMRVPHEPEPPPGAPPKVFRAARNYLTLRIVQFVFTQVVLSGVPLFLLVLDIAVVTKSASGAVLMHVLMVIVIVIFLAQMVFGGAVLRLNYELRWYMLSDRAIRIREGITTVREKTLTLANVQNIAIRQGPLQRLLGIADVEVKTAGGGASAGGPHGKGKSMGEPMHVAFFRGVDNAEEIRDLVREGVRRQKDAGLGDPDQARHHDPTLVSAHTHEDTAAAAGELLCEARKLRAVVEAAALR
jgi:uncharacterized membrane protein YdbT with pleckstrin-like domain